MGYDYRYAAGHCLVAGTDIILPGHIARNLNSMVYCESIVDQ